jgi:thioredoxin-dependent peroxiredoxin
MSKRENAVTFKGEGKTLVGPALKVGDAAPDFETVAPPFTVTRLADTPAKARLFNVVPSLDTGVCAMQTRKFEKALSEHKDKVASYTFSLDLPFAQKRFCGDGEHPIALLQPLSDVRNHSFGKAYGVLLEGLPFPLLTRAVFVVDAGGVILHVEYVSEVTNEPNYDKALDVLKTLAN